MLVHLDSFHYYFFYKDWDKTQVKLFPNFTRHYLITHTYIITFFIALPYLSSWLSAMLY